MLQTQAQAQGAGPLAHLRDIHLPAEVSWWPLAPAWWALGALGGATLVLLWILVWRWRRKWQQLAYQRVALRQLEHLAAQHSSAPATLVRELSVLLRRVATLHAPSSAGFAGEEWLEFLDRTLDSKVKAEPFRTGAGQCLADAPYRPALKSGVDPHALVELTRCWIKNLPPLATKKGRNANLPRQFGRKRC